MREDREALARELGIPVAEELPQGPLALLERVPYSFVKRHLLLPVGESGGSIQVALTDPLNLDALEELRLLLGCEVEPLYASEERLLTAINSCYHQKEGTTSTLIADLETPAESPDTEESYDLLDGELNQAPIVRLLNAILGEAIQQGASDIHFEPFENDLQIRYRIDGVLHRRDAPGTYYQAQLLTRIKVMARMDIAEHRLPQDGRIKLTMGGREIDFRVSTVPVVNGERIVLRILDKSNIALGLESLGMPQALLHSFRNLIGRSEGLVLVTGPTGSGKTTTLYSALRERAGEGINIMTIEDPVEYKLHGIAQMGVHPKIQLDFATGLRHLLRQDPDLLMVGEIRDRETAEIAIQAALTGHLVLSTLHTNDAPSAITRLVDMGIEPYLLSSSLLGVLAQRLVRKVCPHCAHQGCSHCFGSGFQGRHGLYELLEIDSVLCSQIAKESDAAVLRTLALERGMLPLWEHGMELVAQGITTHAEVLRVSRSS